MTQVFPAIEPFETVPILLHLDEEHFVNRPILASLWRSYNFLTTNTMDVDGNTIFFLSGPANVGKSTTLEEIHQRCELDQTAHILVDFKYDDEKFILEEIANKMTGIKYGVPTVILLDSIECADKKTLFCLLEQLRQNAKLGQNLLLVLAANPEMIDVGELKILNAEIIEVENFNLFQRTELLRLSEIVQQNSVRVLFDALESITKGNPKKDQMCLAYIREMEKRGERFTDMNLPEHLEIIQSRLTEEYRD